MAGINKCQIKVQTIGNRVDHVEQNMEEYTSSFNTLVNAHTAQGEELAWLKDKVADLEDRSRRNNIKIGDVPEAIPATQLLQYTQILFSTLVPILTAQDLIVDRIHRIPKSFFLPAETSRDVLLRVHFYHVKEQILIASHSPENIHPQYATLELLPDLFRHTLQRRCNLATVTKALQNHKVSHEWNNPAKLSITHNGTTALISALEEGIDACMSMGHPP